MRLLQASLLALGAFLAVNVAAAEPIRIVALGDSNTAGFGVVDRNTYPSQLERALRAKGYDVEVLNRGVSGDTTARALRRFEAAIPDRVDIAIVFLGRNDRRFFVPVSNTHRNLHEIVGRLRARDIEVILAGFHPMDFSEIAAVHGATYYPDFFDGVAVKGTKSQRYTLFWDIVGHLNESGYREVVSRLGPVVETQVVKVFCSRLGEAVVFAPECSDAWAGITGSIQQR